MAEEEDKQRLSQDSEYNSQLTASTGYAEAEVPYDSQDTALTIILTQDSELSQLSSDSFGSRFSQDPEEVIIVSPRPGSAPASGSLSSISAAATAALVTGRRQMTSFSQGQ